LREGDRLLLVHAAEAGHGRGPAGTGHSVLLDAAADGAGDRVGGGLPRVPGAKRRDRGVWDGGRAPPPDPSPFGRKDDGGSGGAVVPGAVWDRGATRGAGAVGGRGGRALPGAALPGG